jgi:hypothetical protein
MGAMAWISCTFPRTINDARVVLDDLGAFLEGTWASPQ